MPLQWAIYKQQQNKQRLSALLKKKLTNQALSRRSRRLRASECASHGALWRVRFARSCPGNHLI